MEFLLGRFCRNGTIRGCVRYADARPKTTCGIIEGNSVPDVFIPQLIDLYLRGRFPFDKLVKFYPFERINGAAASTKRPNTPNAA